MSRLQKKCLISSLLFHGFLFLSAFVGMAFVAPRPTLDISPFEIIIPPDATLVDDKIVGGGNPNAAPPPPAPRQPTPRPLIQEPRPAPLPESHPEPRIVPEERSHKIEPNLTPKKIVPNLNETTSKEPDRRSEDRARREKARELAKALRNEFSNVGRAISDNTSSSTVIDVLGPGGGAFANYALYVKQTYEDAWHPSEALNDNSEVAVEVVIARDGTVLSSSISKKSGNSALDNSVQEALNRVRFVRKFPEGAKEQKRTFRITYSLISTRRG